MKKILSFAITIALMLTLLPFTAFATDLPSGANGWLVDSGDNHVWYQLTENDTVLTIGGSGAMPDDYNEYGHYPWSDSRDKITTIIIESSVTNIGEEAFFEYTGLVSITLPDNLISISDYAFSGCTSLESITLPDNLINIGDNAFSGCTSLESITLPDNLISISDYAFSGCTSLESITLPDNLISIGDCAFSGCTSLESITLPDILTSIGNEEGGQTFAGCIKLTSINIPDNVTKINSGLFLYCENLESITLPAVITAIDKNAFYGCNSLATITIKAENPPTLGDCALATGDDDPYPLPKLSKIYVPVESVGTYKSADGWKEYKDKIFPLLGTYTVTINVNDATYGSVDFTSISGIAAGTSVSAIANVLTVGDKTITASPAAMTSEYTYSFKQWTGIPSTNTVTTDCAITAVFERTSKEDPHPWYPPFRPVRPIIPVTPVTPVEPNTYDVCDGGEKCIMNSFTDLDPSAWYHDGVHYCLDNGIMEGMGDVFSPDGKTTRAQVVTMLWRLAKEPYVNYAMAFKDIEADTWYTEAVRWAASEKIVEGYSTEKFGPNDAITREQLATIIYNYVKSQGGGFKGNWMFLLSANDRAEISSWAYEPVCWCYMNEILEGKGDIFDPKGTAKRCETAAVFQRFCELNK